MYDVIQPAFVERILDEHTTGKVNHRLLIWSFLSFEWWMRLYLDGGNAAGPASDPIVAASDAVPSPARI